MWFRNSIGLAVCFTLAVIASPIHANENDSRSDEELRFGITAVFLSNQTGLLERWRQYLEQRLDRPVRFVQRNTYREITNELLQGKIDLAWICGYPYVRNQPALSLVAVPRFKGRPEYQSYLIVPSDDQETSGLRDLAGSVFAYSDPDSNSGYLYRQYQLKKENVRDSEFFRRTFFAYGHRNVVEAVAVGLADAGSVDGYVWETLKKHEPELVAQTRVASRSPWFGHPPIVARSDPMDDDMHRVRQVLTEMQNTQRGRRLLEQFNLDGFSVESPSLFQGIAEMMRYVEG